MFQFANLVPQQFGEALSQHFLANLWHCFQGFEIWGKSKHLIRGGGLLRVPSPYSNREGGGEEGDDLPYFSSDFDD